MQFVQLSPFVAGATYTRTDNTVVAGKTVVVASGGKSQTLTYNLAGELLAASNPT